MFQVYNPDNFQRDQGVTENVKYEKKHRIGEKKTGIFGHSVPFPKNIELLFNPNESLLYLIRKTPIKSAKSSLLPPIE